MANQNSCPSRSQRGKEYEDIAASLMRVSNDYAAQNDADKAWYFRKAANAIRELLAAPSETAFSKKPLSVEIKDDVLTFSIGVETLAYAIQQGPNWPSDVKVTDARTFAKDVLRELEREEEDGTTPVHRMLDARGRDAMENGSEGCSE